ncbi:hypothetical protein ACFFRR_006755 [Megaselia abdita]
MTLPKVKNSLASKTAKPQKLKCVLAQPFPKYRPVITPSDAESLLKIISSSHWKDKCTFGLRSSLRKTNNSSDFSCLLISTKIKPFFISWQIIHSAAVREKIPKVFCFPNLEELTLNIFKKKSTALVIPSLAAKEIQSWLREQQELHPIPRNLLPKENSPVEKVMKVKEFTPSINVGDFYVKSSENRAFVPKIIKRKNKLSLEREDKSWSGDFISFGDVEMKDVDNVDSEEERDNLQNMLSRFSTEGGSSVSWGISADDSKEKVPKENSIQESKKKESVETKDVKPPSEDEFLEDYIGVTVQKIQKNPDKVKKKKKKKNKLSSKK